MNLSPPGGPIRLSSLQIGQPQTYGDPQALAPDQRLWNTSFFRTAVAGPVWAGPLGLEGDAVADTVNHGGPDKALLAYSLDHYADWRAELGLESLPPGAFGENLSITGQCERDVCLADRWRLGDAELEVSQPRQPCWKLARRWNIKDLPARVIATGRTGWYLRVVTSGVVQAGDRLELIARPQPDWTVERANEVMHHHRSRADLARELASVVGLSASWAGQLTRRAERGPEADD